MTESHVIIQDSEESDYEAVVKLPPAKRVKLLAESKSKEEAKTDEETDEETGEESDDYETDSE